MKRADPAKFAEQSDALAAAMGDAAEAIGIHPEDLTDMLEQLHQASVEVLHEEHAALEATGFSGMRH